MQYEVITPIRYNGDRYEPGGKMELEAFDAAPLIQAGALRPLPKPQKKAQEPDTIHEPAQEPEKAEA